MIIAGSRAAHTAGNTSFPADWETCSAGGGLLDACPDLRNPSSALSPNAAWLVGGKELCHEGDSGNQRQGGAGKTSLTAALAGLMAPCVLVDCDVDAADLHLLLQPEVQETHPFISDKSRCLTAPVRWRRALRRIMPFRGDSVVAAGKPVPGACRLRRRC